MGEKVFICHSSKDRKNAEKLVADLEREGIACWISFRDIPYGDSHQRNITPAIEESAAFIFLFTSNSNDVPENGNDAREILKEFTVAARYQKIVIPARLEDIEPRGGLEYELRSCQYVDLFNDYDSKIKELCSRIADISNNQQLKEKIEGERIEQERIEQERTRKWRYKVALASIFALIVLPSVSWVGYTYYQTSKSNVPTLASIPRSESISQIENSEKATQPTTTTPKNNQLAPKKPSIPSVQAKPVTQPKPHLPVVQASIAQNLNPRTSLAQEANPNQPIYVYSSSQDNMDQGIVQVLRTELQQSGYTVAKISRSAKTSVDVALAGVDAPVFDASGTLIKWSQTAHLNVSVNRISNGSVLFSGAVERAAESRSKDVLKSLAIHASIAALVQKLNGIIKK